MLVARNIGADDRMSKVMALSWLEGALANLSGVPSDTPVMLDSFGTGWGWGHGGAMEGRPAFVSMTVRTYQETNEALNLVGSALTRFSPIPTTFKRDWEKEQFPA